MLFSRFCASLVALAVSTTPSLTLKISTPNANVDGLENLEITTTIINTDDEILKLLNDPRGILDSLPENSFTVTDASGSRPSFTDAKVKYSPTYAAGLNDPSTSVFTLLAPGASIDVTNDPVGLWSHGIITVYSGSPPGRGHQASSFTQGCLS